MVSRCIMQLRRGKIQLKILAQKNTEMRTKFVQLQGEKATGSDNHRFAGHRVSVPPYADGQCTELGGTKREKKYGLGVDVKNMPMFCSESDVGKPETGNQYPHLMIDDE